MDKTPIVILGGSAAGISAAQAMVEAGNQGKITLITSEGFLPYKRTKISKSFAVGDEPEAFTLQPPAWFAQQGIELLLGRTVMAIDLQSQTVLLDQGARLPWHRLILALGATPRRLALPQDVLSKIHYAYSKAQVAHLRMEALKGQKALVVGTGVLGTEVTEQLSLMGLQVTMVGEEPTMMSRELNPVASHLLAETLQQNKIELLLGEKVQSMKPGSQGLIVELSSGRRTFDLVISCIGMIPAVALAQQAGLKVNQGVLVDSLLCTSHPHIFAAGDVAEHPDGRVTHLWRHALDQGRVAGLNAMGAGQTYRFEPFRLKCNVFENYFFSLDRPSPGEEDQYTVVEQWERPRYRCGYYRGKALCGLVMCNDEPNQKLYNTAVVEGWDRQQLEQRSGWPLTNPI